MSWTALREPEEWDQDAQGWFERSVPRMVRDAMEKMHVPTEDTEEIVDQVVAEVLADRPRFIEWQDDDRFRPDCSNGAFVFLADQLEEAIASGLAVRTKTTTGQWTVQTHIKSASEGRERGLHWLLARDVATKVAEAHRKMIARWPRRCSGVGCGTEFTSRQPRQRRCLKCVERDNPAIPRAEIDVEAILASGGEG